MAAGDAGIWVKVISPTELETNRWSYSWKQQRLVQYGKWQDKEGGKSSESTGIVAYNSIESNNGETGMQGNSINTSVLPEGAELVPVSGSPVVYARFVMNCASEEADEDDPESDYLELIFSYENAVSTPDCEAGT